MPWAVIGGSGALPLALSLQPVEVPESRYGSASADVLAGEVGTQTVLFLARHGTPHRIAPHDINYRANIDVLRGLGVEGVIALNTVGGISASAVAGSLHLPDQIIDYTWGREHTFSDAEELIHADFADPFADGLRRRLRQAGDAAGVAVHQGGVYGATQGPRFETAAEIERMARDGCDLVGMTGMPEAALAREAGLPYAMLSLVVNPAAGRARDPFDLDAIAAVSAAGMADVERLLRRFFAAVDLQGGKRR
ncbi:MAG: S-methyl-5'-thioinosine phosphorylase [Pseudomonadales bacterium]